MNVHSDELFCTDVGMLNMQRLNLKGSVALAALALMAACSKEEAPRRRPPPRSAW